MYDYQIMYPIFSCKIQNRYKLQAAFFFIFRAFYTRRKFRPIYAKVMNKGQSMANQSARQFGAMSLLAGALPGNANPCLFDYPFNELLVITI